MEVSFPENQAVSQPSTEAHSVSYKLLGIQRGTEPCLTVFLHRAFLTASFQSKLSKWCYRAHSRCKVSVWGFFTTVSLSRKINFCFGSQLSSVKPGEKCHCFQCGLDQVRALYISLCSSFQQQAQTGFLWLFHSLYTTNWRSGHQKSPFWFFDKLSGYSQNSDHKVRAVCPFHSPGELNYKESSVLCCILCHCGFQLAWDRTILSSQIYVWKGPWAWILALNQNVRSCFPHYVFSHSSPHLQRTV